MLTREDILKEMAAGRIIDPPELTAGNPNSVNFRLGWELTVPRTYAPGQNPGGVANLHTDPHSPVPQYPLTALQLAEFTRDPKWAALHEEGDRSYYHMFLPGVPYIGATLDDHGTVLDDTGIAFVPQIKARSTTGRNALTVALCAGQGDIGYHGKWALEIHNFYQRPVALAVGTEIGQFIYFRANSPVYPGEGYAGEGRYMREDGSIQLKPKAFAHPGYLEPPTEIAEAMAEVNAMVGSDD